MKCEDCRWWDVLSPEGTVDEEKTGQCHRYAPVPKYLFSIVTNCPDKEEIAAYGIGWAFTEFNDWCGEFVQK